MCNIVILTSSLVYREVKIDKRQEECALLFFNKHFFYYQRYSFDTKMCVFLIILTHLTTFYKPADVFITFKF